MTAANPGPRPATGTGRPPRRLPPVDDYVAGVRAGIPAWLARAITLVESTRPDHREHAQRMLVALSPYAGQARRVGVTGVPGVGKSTFIDALGTQLTDDGHRVAVLAVDPSSARSGGSILGDKTRMARLAGDPAAFVRPSPTAGTLGGVARATREAMVVVEAGGYDVVLVETVGVGQSETTVADMVDTFLLLTLARTGDQLQGIKKGVLELADIVVVNKADGAHAVEARAAARELAGALRMLRTDQDAWTVPVSTASGRDGTGLAEVWQQVLAHQDRRRASGDLDRDRQRQQLRWVWAMVHDGLLDRLHRHPAVTALTPDVEARVLAGELTPAQAAARLLAAFGADPAPPTSRQPAPPT
ncbi:MULTISPECIES: methylmalonyl Co-A mutase-associated GTPase MeaB [unclassified Solwaraspora]|uniref:methylmalonyl Co-A mutase-associated GTPase MeaB n=1 Tax=unclassified Solwaraspora TaxID=2627926 RepID=UPI00259B750D|nr:methylmalonyl Co-A mutase-associated GTPase MeaB [Solwaraspora sp. WMMA2056]WJK38820.1 methylmalonyl Co-A mutase-associated GTPase MeaB [Solwaraspora sp. WMMA2056]